MSLENSISNFLQQLQTQDFDLYKFQSNKLGNDFDSEKDSVFYSGPYWDNREIAAILESVLEGKWLSSGEKVNKFERQFSKVINADFSLMVNSGSSANLVLIAALKKHFGWQDGDEIIVCAWLLALDIQLGLLYLFSHLNPADVPSRSLVDFSLALSSSSEGGVDADDATAIFDQLPLQSRRGVSWVRLLVRLAVHRHVSFSVFHRVPLQAI